MTHREIALFKAYLKNRGMDALYVSFYKRNRWKHNPASIEEFFKDVDAKDACIKAFYFITNRAFGADYWMEFQEGFNDFLAKRESSITDEDILYLKGEAATLRQNWDLQKFWNSEGRFEASRRNGIDLPLDALETIAEAREKQGLEIDKELSALIASKRRQANIDKFDSETQETVNVESGDDGNDGNDDIINGFEIEDFTKKAHARYLNDNEISINMRNKGGRITFNQKITKEIAARGSYEYATIGVNKNNELMLLLNDERGVPMQDVRMKEGNTTNATINSKKLVGRIYALLGIEGDYETLNVKEACKTNDYVGYIVTRK